MADQKVSALTALIASGLTAADELYIVDVSEAVPADRSKKVLLGDLLQTIFANMVANASNGPAILNETPSNTNPVFAPNKTDLSTGMGWLTTGQPCIIGSGAEIMRFGSVVTQLFGGAIQGSVAGAFYIENTAATNTNPTLCPSRTDQSTGLGWVTGGNLVMVSSGTEVARFTTGVGLTMNSLQVKSMADPTAAQDAATKSFVDKSNAAVQARRTTPYTITTAFADIPLDVTDIETDATVLDHDLVTNNDRIIALAAGTYYVTYDIDMRAPISNNQMWEIEARVRLNDTGTGIAGSTARSEVLADNSLGGLTPGPLHGHLTNGFLVTLAVNDFLTLQLLGTDLTANAGNPDMENITVKVVRVK